MKDSYYFPHDYHARNDPKLEELFLKTGCEGRGIYWTLIEMLYENNGYLPLDGKLNYYANALRTECESITSVLNDYGLFKNDGKRFWSDSCLSRLERLQEKREKARQSSFKRWENNAKALGTHNKKCDGIPIKESKVKESKVNIKERYLEFVLLTKEEHGSLIKNLGETTTNDFIARLNDYIGSKGDKYKSHYHTIKNWHRKDNPKQNMGTTIKKAL